MTKERAFLLNRINCLAFVACNFLKSFTTNLHDNRSYLINYFVSMETGQAFMRLVFEGYRKFNWDLVFINNRNTSEPIEESPNLPLQKLVDSDLGSNILPTGTVEFRGMLPVATCVPGKIPLRRLDHGAFERLIQATIARVQKQLVEIIISMSKTFCNTVTRPRRNYDCITLKNAYIATEMVFDGVVHILEYDDILFNHSSWR